MGLNGYIGNWCTVNVNITCCCERMGCSSCKWSDVEDEFCVIAQANSKQVMPTSCVKTTGQTCCLDQRVSFPAEDVEGAEREIPCMFALGGMNFVMDNQCRMGCCQTVHTLRHGEIVSDGCPFVTGTCGDCTCCTACCTPTEETDVPVANAVPADGVAKAQPTGTEDEVPEADGGKKAQIDGKTKVGDLNTCCGFCCCLESLYCRFPEVFGCFGEGTVCCLSVVSSSCKPLVKKGDIFDNEICLICDQRCACISPTTCVMCTCQEHCIDYRCALPCNGDEVPCVLNLCFINCMYEYESKFGCTLWEPLKQFAAQTDNGMATKENTA